MTKLDEIKARVADDKNPTRHSDAVWLVGEVERLSAEGDARLSTLESVRYALGKVARFASGQEVPPASDGAALLGYLNGALSRMVAEIERLTPAAAGHRYAAGMAEAGEAIANQELEGERAHSAKLRATIRLIEEALVSDGSRRPVWGEGDELDHVVWDVRTLCRKLDEAKADNDRLRQALRDGAADVEALKAKVRSGEPVPPVWAALDGVAARLREAAGEGGGR